VDERRGVLKCLACSLIEGSCSVCDVRWDLKANSRQSLITHLSVESQAEGDLV